MRELAATQGKRFAVIADEAHSSQTSEAAAKLKAVLSVEELVELNDGGEVSTEDILAAQMAARAGQAGQASEGGWMQRGTTTTSRCTAWWRWR